MRQGDLNALANNISNLYGYNQGGFRTQRDCVIATQTTGQSIPNITDVIVNFNQATVNTNNMWAGAQPQQITIQTAGIYWIFAQARWPSLGGATLSTACASNVQVNGTALGANLLPFVSTGSGPVNQAGVIANLAVGAIIRLDVWQSSGAAQTMPIDFGGTYLGAVFLTPSS